MIGIRCTTEHLVTEDDLASVIYPHLGKPPVLATARLVRWCELAAMEAMPGVSLGTRVVVDHVAPAVVDTVVTVAAACTGAAGRYWEWDVAVRAEVIALVTLGFVEIDPDDYCERRVIPKLAAVRSTERGLRSSCARTQ